MRPNGLEAFATIVMDGEKPRPDRKAKVPGIIRTRVTRTGDRPSTGEKPQGVHDDQPGIRFRLAADGRVAFLHAACELQPSARAVAVRGRRSVRHHHRPIDPLADGRNDVSIAAAPRVRRDRLTGPQSAANSVAVETDELRRRQDTAGRKQVIGNGELPHRDRTLNRNDHGEKQDRGRHDCRACRQPAIRCDALTFYM